MKLYEPMVEFLAVECDKLTALPEAERNEAMAVMMYGVAKTLGSMLAAQPRPNVVCREFVLALIDEFKKASK
jgi:hypothetical protein